MITKILEAVMVYDYENEEAANRILKSVWLAEENQTAFVMMLRKIFVNGVLYELDRIKEDLEKSMKKYNIGE